MAVFNQQRGRSSGGAQSFFSPPSDPLYALMGQATHHSNNGVTGFGSGSSLASFGSPTVAQGYGGGNNSDVFAALAGSTYGHSPVAFPILGKDGGLETQFKKPESILPGDVALAQAFLASSYVENDGSYVDAFLKAEELITQAQAMVSTAEKAMRNASGMRSPMECWGCKDDPRYHGQRFHRFSACPYKDDPEVRARAESVMKKLYGDRSRYQKKRDASALLSEEYLSPIEVKSQWKDHGFKSETQANLVCTLLARKTSKRARKRISISEDRNQGSDSPSGILNLVTIPMALNATPQVIDLSVTQYLPHVQLCLGLANEQFTMKTAADTCAGLNLGELKYHQGVMALFPSAVVNFVDLSLVNQQIHVGGVGNSGGLTVTHVVTYRMPVKKDGIEARISFGLSEQAVASALIGVGFFTRTKAVISFANKNDPALIIAKLGLNLPITYEQPTVRPPPKSKDTSQAYYVALQDKIDRIGPQIGV